MKTILYDPYYVTTHCVVVQKAIDLQIEKLYTSGTISSEHIFINTFLFLSVMSFNPFVQPCLHVRGDKLHMTGHKLYTYRNC